MKKFIPVIAVALLMLTVFVACKKDTDETTKSASTTKAATTEAQTSAGMTDNSGTGAVSTGDILD